MAPAGIAAGGAGELDPAFGVSGKAITDFGGRIDSARSVAVRRAGGIVAAGASGSAGLNQDFAVAAYTPQGTLDPSFGVGGRVVTDLGGSFEGADAVAVDRNGRVVAVGTTNAGGLLRFAIVRYDQNGGLDSSFGAGGVVLTQVPGSFGDFASGVAVQPDGKIVVVGSANRPGPNQDIVVARYEEDGSLDETFGIGGISAVDLGASIEGATAVALSQRGKIVVTGTWGSDLSNIDFAVVRYEDDGQLDESFGDGGMALTDVGPLDFARDVAVRPNGAIVVGGGSETDIVLVGLEKDGRRSAKFGDSGIVRTDLGGFGDSAAAIAMTASGELVVAGTGFGNTSADFAVLRYDRDGTLDDEFGNGGVVLTDLGDSTQDIPTDVALERDRSIVVAGTFDVGRSFDFAVVRYRPR